MGMQVKKELLECIKISAFIIGISMWCTIQADQIPLNFSSFSPSTWYQKGLESTVKVWHSIVQMLEGDEKSETAQLPFEDALLGRLAFGQFCIESMRRQSKQPVDEDIHYFATVLRKIQDLLTLVRVAPSLRDRIDCVSDMLNKMQKILVPLHVPSDINAIGTANNIGVECSFASKL